MSKTESVRAALKQLPTIHDQLVSELIAPLREAEKALEAAQLAYDKALKGIAAGITEDGDGWSLEEIQNTALRGETAIVREARRIIESRSEN